jgi:eukaryotic-like serine/threonine-protein kinase
MPLSAGDKLGPYEILAPIGAGGMGEVYKARDTRLDRIVAIKQLKGQHNARFEQEARAVAALNHPHICQIYDIGPEYLVMEYVEGRPLQGPLGAEEAAKLAIQIAGAVEEAHGRGILHRDLKPANILVTGKSAAKLLDFGLAKLTTDSDTDATRTIEGTVMGTAAYMSPEQAEGKPLDERSDIFSFGAVLYEMLSGKRAFSGTSAAQVISAVLRDEPTPLQAPAGLQRIVKRCLAKQPEDRYPSMGQVRQALEKLAEPAAAGARVSAVWRWPALAAVVILMGLAVYLITRSGYLRPASGAPETAIDPHAIRSIAVLPLDNYSGDPNQEYFAEGMTDELTADLDNISQLRVISRGSAMQFKGEHRPPAPEIAKRLNVDAVVEGSVLRAGDKVRITARLIDARADRHLWAKSFERNSRDVLALQDELASAIASEIHVQLTPIEQSRLASAPSVNPEAYDAYLKGRYFFNRPTDENLKKAIAQFEEAVKLSPNYAPAFSGLSDAYLWAGYNEGVLTASEARPKAKAAAERAIQLVNNSAEAHTSLAVFKLFYEYDWTGCEIEFRRAFALNPNYAFAHDQFGLGLAFQSRFEESMAEGKRASELDPLSPQIPMDAIFAFVWQGKYQAAKELVKRAADLDPTFSYPPWSDGWTDIQAGNIRAAIPKIRKAEAMESPAFIVAWLGYAYGASGDRTHALAEMEELKKRSLGGSVTPFNLALVYLGLGDRARALDYLERAYASDSQWLAWLKNDRIFDPLRSEPRFVALMRKLRFDK